MNYREFTCVVCGTKATDRSHSQNRMYCSVQCRDIGFRRNHGVGVSIKTPSCVHNKEIACQIHKCSTCGWNPEVEQKRKAALV